MYYSGLSCDKGKISGEFSCYSGVEKKLVLVLDKKNNSAYYNLIKVLYEKTSMPLILNTLFNVVGEPIIETLEDAIKCFLDANMDYLIIENYIIKKNETSFFSPF